MANASSLNTLYSLINGPNADRIGGFIYNAQVDDAARQREATRQADANLALGNKQAEYSLASALSRSPETAAMFRPGREILAPGTEDMAYSLMGNVPKMQDAELKSKQADYDYKLALTDRARREPIGSGGDKGITAYQQRQIELDERKLNQTDDIRAEDAARQILKNGEEIRAKYYNMAEQSRLVNPAAAKLLTQRGEDAYEKSLADANARLARGQSRSGTQAAPQSPQSVQPTAAPQARTSTAPAAAPVDRSWHVEHAKTALARVTDPARRAEIMATAAKNGVTERDLAK